MTKTLKNTRIRVVGSSVLVVASILLATLIGINMPFHGIVSSTGVHAWILWPFIIPLVWFIVALALLPGGIMKFFKGVRLKVILLALVIAASLTLLTTFVPFPGDTPPCCMTGPSRDRGLPITFTESHKDFGALVADPYPEPEYNFGWLATDIVIWSLIVIYIYRVRNIMKGDHV